MEKLIKMWQERQKHYEDLAQKHKDSEHNYKKFTYKAIATRDCWKELLTEIVEVFDNPKHYTEMVYDEWVENSDSFAIAFYEWRSTSLIKNIDQYTNKEVLEMYKKHLKDTAS